MSKPLRIAMVLVVAMVALANTTPATASRIDDSIKKTRTGYIQFEFPTRDGVVGNGRNVISTDDGHSMRINLDDNQMHCNDCDEWDIYRRECSAGPARVLMKVKNRKVVDMHVTVGAINHDIVNDYQDLGTIPVTEAADYLLDMAEDADRRVVDDAMFAATLSDAVIWPRLLEIARNRGAAQKVRKSAVFWTGQIAGQKAVEGLTTLVDDDSMEIEVRKSAIFSLSQCRNVDSTKRLISVVRTNRHPQLIKSALFWLAQSEEDEALALFEEILTN